MNTQNDEIHALSFPLGTYKQISIYYLFGVKEALKKQVLVPGRLRVGMVAEVHRGSSLE